MSVRWVVQKGDDAQEGEEGEGTVLSVLGRLGETSAAVAEGRVFRGRHRVETAEEEVRAGDEIIVHDAPAEPANVEILSEWRGLVAVGKPAGLPTEPDRRGGASLVRAAARVLGVPFSDLHAATRLDRSVSGVVVVARGAAAKRDVAALQQGGSLLRRYVALVTGAPLAEAGEWNAPIGRDARGRPCAFGQGARPARTLFRRIARAGMDEGSVQLLCVEPATGRTHQIRVHAALAEAPLLGDPAHGGPRRLALAGGTVRSLDRVFLHALRTEVVLGGEIVWSARCGVPPELLSTWAALGGERGAFDAASSVPVLYSR